MNATPSPLRRGLRIHFGRLLLLTALALAGCATQETRRDAINDINTAFRAEYETILASKGRRTFDVAGAVAFDATNAALTRLGLVVEQRSPALGFISVEAPAPLPLTRAEWDRAAAADLPKTRAILARHIGPLAEFFTFEPEGLDNVITATIIETRGRAEISFTMRMREVAPPKQNLPRREYPPPTALQAGLDKIWGVVDREIAARSAKP